MPGLDHAHAPQGPSVTVTRDGNTAQPLGGDLQLVEVMRLGDFGHRTRRLARCDQDQPTRRWWWQERRQARRRMRRCYRNAVEVCEKRAQGAIHDPIIAAHHLENLLIIID